jgi:guanylate kinase
MDDWGDLPARLFVVSGPSGAGKSTVARRLVQYPGVKARLSISATTRAPRPGERDGVDYYFMTRPAFEAARDRGEFLEWAEVHGNLYGTPAAPLRALMAEGTSPILVIDVQGGLQVRDRVPGAVLVFVNTPGLEELEARLRARGTDGEATIRTRLANARAEVEQGRLHYPIQIVNDDLDQAVAALADVVSRHGRGG